MAVLTNVIGAVESGGQVYGHRNYAAYAAPYANTPNEHTITLGWAQNYGPEAQELIRRILAKSETAFRRLDKCKPSIMAMLEIDWTDTRWHPSKEQAEVLVALIDSVNGRKAQDELFAELMRTYIKSCEADYTSKVKPVMMYCEIRHLGGRSAADRIFKRCKGDYSLDAIMSALVADQKDKSSENQVGDTKFWSRHVKCYQFIEQYAKEESEMDAKQRAKVLLRQTGLKVMTGYTPEGAQCYKNESAWVTVPKKGYVVYFYGKPAGENYRICHTGIVESVNASDKTFTTIEGNTSGGAFTTNGGSVARHTYSYKAIGGTNRVNGFGVPNFSAAGITADQFVAVAESYVGYEEKASNACLDDFHKNAGSNNFQKFERDVIGCSGDQWCQYFVDACALYAAQGVKAEPVAVTKCSVTLREIQKGDAGQDVETAQTLLVHKWGISCGKWGADGEFGADTDKAVREFQRKKGLDPDGVIGKNTWSALLG